MTKARETTPPQYRQIPTFTPTMLATFERCPLLYRRRYIAKDLPPDGFSRELVRGNALHNVLAPLFDHFRRHQSFPLNLRDRVAAQLPREGYAEQAAWASDVDQVLAWVKWALRAFDGTPQVVAVERYCEYEFPGNGSCQRFRLRHKVDLVLRRADATIEHLDWKTGTSHRIEALHNAAARIVVGRAFPDRSRILSTTAFVVNEAVRTDELTYEEVKVGWERIKGLVQGILAEAEWLPVSTALCPWCPLYGRGCPLYPTDDVPDAMTQWLEGAA
jgi:hypothetical protein